jgi:hypothetical protein
VVEQRRSRRFELKLPVEVVRTGSIPTRKIGETRNLSSSGVLILTDARFPIGESIEYLITLPVRCESGDPMVRLRCMGKIVRQEGSGSAATLERYEFLRG